MFNTEETNKNNFKNKLFVGIVEENIDEKRKGRIKIRVQGVFEKIDLKHIPWASPYSGIDGKSFSIPAVGKIVNVIFPNGDIYEPSYIYSENCNINLSNKLKNMDDDEYKNFISLLFDHRTQIYSDDTSLTLDYYFNQLNITNNSINLELKNNEQKINLGSDNAEQSAVLGDNFFKWMDTFMDTLLNPVTLTGNFGAPILRPKLDMAINEYKAKRKSFLSYNVKLNDNDKIEEKLDRDIATQSKTQDDVTINNVNLFGDDVIKTTPKKNKDIEDKDIKEKILDNNNKEIEKTRNNSAESPNEDMLSDDYHLILNTLKQENNINNDVKVDMSPTEGPFTTIEDNDKTVTGDDPYSDFFAEHKTDNKNGTYLNKNDKRLDTFNNITKTPTNEIKKDDNYGDFWVNIGGREAKTFKEEIEPIPYTKGDIKVQNSGTIPKNITNGLKDLDYIDMPINTNKYFKGQHKKTKLILHWTAGWGYAKNVKTGWEASNSKVSTSWILSSKVVSGYKIDDKNDGLLYRLYDDKNAWSYHSSAGSKIHKTSIGMEICNIGWLTKKGNVYRHAYNNGIFKHNNEVLDLGYKFRGYQYFQKLSDNQLYTLKNWITAMANEHNIQIQNKFEKSYFLKTPPSVYNVNQHGIFLHTHYKSSGKWDLPPQDELLDMLNSL